MDEYEERIAAAAKKFAVQHGLWLQAQKVADEAFRHAEAIRMKAGQAEMELANFVGKNISRRVIRVGDSAVVVQYHRDDSTTVSLETMLVAA